MRFRLEVEMVQTPDVCGNEQTMSTPAGADSSMEALSLSLPRRRMEFAAESTNALQRKHRARCAERCPLSAQHMNCR